jgi:subtilase family serine protease
MLQLRNFALLVVFCCCLSQHSYAETVLTNNSGQYIPMPKGMIFFPDSSMPKADGYVHTNYVVFFPASNAFAHETPSSLACIYSLTTASPGCNPATTTLPPTGGWGTIAIVDAFDHSLAEYDLSVFSKRFNLPACTTANGCFTQVFASGKRPLACDTNPQNNWCLEIDLDIEWAHAMAPNAKIMLVEAASNSRDDLYYAVKQASQLVDAHGGGDISNSWSGGEFPEETQPYPVGLDDIFHQYNDIVYFAATGDRGAPAEYPGTSPYIIAAGGTSVVRDDNGNFQYENGWGVADTCSRSSSTGGPSLYEPVPVYQNGVSSIITTQRGVPDISFDGDPQSGVWVYDSKNIGAGWLTIGGTSVSSPALAGVINIATGHATSTVAELTKIYSGLSSHYNDYWRKSVSGNNCIYSVIPGYNFVTGIGSPIGYPGK